MKHVFFLLTALIGFSLTLQPQTSSASEYEEISYDDLVGRLNSRRSQLNNPTENPLDETKIRAGFGVVSTLTQVAVNGSNTPYFLNGFMLSIGIDLFSPNWSAEAALRNFGSSSTRALKETDVRILYRNLFSPDLGYHLGAGLSTRDLKFNDQEEEFKLNNSAPAAIFAFGLDFYLNNTLSIGVEMGFRPVLLPQSPDKFANDLSLRMDAAF